MPEVCEVCLTSQYMSKAIGHKITKIEVVRGRYLKTPIKGFDNLNYPLTIVDIQTKGKFLWLTLKHNDETYYLLNTFGLTGQWSFEKIDYTNVKFTIDSNSKIKHLYFADVRNFGTIEITNDRKKLDVKLNKLAPDLLTTEFTSSDIQDRFKSIKNNKKKIVEVLMSQEARNGIGSGLGNYLVPEILYLAKISPHRQINSLSTDDIHNLTKAIKITLRLCYIANTTEYIDHLKKFLLSHKKYVESGKFPNYHNLKSLENKSFHFNVYGRKVDDDGNSVVGEKILTGRTTYWVPDIQK